MRTKEEALLAPAVGDRWETAAGTMVLVQRVAKRGFVTWSRDAVDRPKYREQVDRFRRWMSDATYLGGAE